MWRFHLAPASSCVNCLCLWDFIAIYLFPLALWCNLEHFAGLEAEIVICGEA